MFDFLNPFAYYRAKKRARLEAEKQIALRRKQLEEALDEAKRRKEYADHLDELRRIVREPLRVVPPAPSRPEYQPTYSTADSVTNLLNSISEQSRVTAFEMGFTDTGSSDCSPSSDSSSDSSCSSSD